MARVDLRWPALPPPIDTSPSSSTLDPADLLSVGQVAAQLGVNQSTLRSRLKRSMLRFGRRWDERTYYGRTYYSRADVQKIREALT